MLFACVLILTATVLYLARDREAAWRMVFSWWRKFAPDDRQEPEAQADAKAQHDHITDGEQDDSNVTTPKVEARKPQYTVPTLALADFSSDSEDELPPPQFPALNSAQRASKVSQPTETAHSQRSNTSMKPPSLMPPPPRPAPSIAPRPSPSAALRVPASTTNGLRVSSTGPLPNRGPPQSSSLQVHLTTSVSQPNPRKKIILAPGHSPLDWAHLQRTQPNLSGVSGFTRVTPSMLKSYNGRKGRPAWSSYQGKVYNITPYLPFHPGGEGELRRCAGKDGEKLFMDVHPWVNWDNMLEQCLVGILVSENDPNAVQTSPLDEMD